MKTIQGMMILEELAMYDRIDEFSERHGPASALAGKKIIFFSTPLLKGKSALEWDANRETD